MSPNAIQFTFIRGQPDFIESLERDAALPVLFGWSLILWPGQIVFLELIIDPVCSIVFEAERANPDLERRPPRLVGEPQFDRRVVVSSFQEGAGVLLASAGVAAGA